MARTVVYGTNRLTVEDDKLTPDQIKQSMSEIFAELANATYEVRGTEVHFTVKAGTKGQSVIIFNTLTGEISISA
jgi:hypothetical protein